jgi:hypothetical protein
VRAKELDGKINLLSLDVDFFNFPSRRERLFFVFAFPAALWQQQALNSDEKKAVRARSLALIRMFTATRRCNARLLMATLLRGTPA